jgi:hypothetical protein
MTVNQLEGRHVNNCWLLALAVSMASSDSHALNGGAEEQQYLTGSLGWHLHLPKNYITQYEATGQHCHVASTDNREIRT